MGSFGLISDSNIIRNGFGTRVVRFSQEIDNDMHDDEFAIPPGHSGIYIESTLSIIQNTLMAGNSLSALSVVRGGSSNVKDCDLIENGSDPAMVQEINDAFLQTHPDFQNMIGGSITDLGGNILGHPVHNPRSLETAKKRFRSPVPENIRQGHLTFGMS